MASDPIPVLHVRGTHREVGRQIGEAQKHQIVKYVELAATLRDRLPAKVTWDQMIDMGRLFLIHSRTAYPQYIDELEGIAEGAGVSLEGLFVDLCEELWERPAWRAHAGYGGPAGQEPAPPTGLQVPSLGTRNGWPYWGQTRGCTDFSARGRATVDGSTLIAHTNDLDPEVEKDLILLRVQAGDEPEFLGVSIAGLGYSAGFNAAGICMSGNWVSCNDIRPGVPRLLLVRAILAARRLGEAMNACLLRWRASNYNNVIADANGEIYSMEGSATDCEPIYTEGDVGAHANHYVSLPMRHFETDRNDIGDSVIRYNRAIRLVRENHGWLSPELFRKLLTDHANYPASICRHGPDSVTVFAMVLDLNRRTAWIGRGRPCETQWCKHTLEPWAGTLPGVRV
jgi:isopenicillin-N N-acyltransferase-like protein